MVLYFFIFGVVGMLFLLIFLLLLLIVFYEVGYYYVVKLCGIDSKEFVLGRGLIILCVCVMLLGCKFVLCMFFVGGMVIYDDCYCELGYVKCVFMSLVGWMMDVVVVIVVIMVVVFLGVIGLLIMFLCILVGMCVVCNLLFIIDDGWKMIWYFWLVVIECIYYV